MDPNTIHYLIHTVLGIVIAVLGWFFRTNNQKQSDMEKKMADLEKELSEHKLQDAAEFAKLNTKSDDVMRRLESIENKLDRILERE